MTVIAANNLYLIQTIDAQADNQRIGKGHMTHQIVIGIAGQKHLPRRLFSVRPLGFRIDRNLGGSVAANDQPAGSSAVP